MAWSVISSTVKTLLVDTVLITSAINTSGADAIIIIIEWREQFGGTLTVSDSQGNTWVPGTLYDDGGIYRGRTFICVSPTTNASHTFTANQNEFMQQVGMNVIAVSGCDQTTPIYAETPNINGMSFFPSNTAQIGSITPPTGGLVISTLTGFQPVNPVTSYSINSSFSVLGFTDDGNGITASAAYKESSSAENPTWTANPSGSYPAGSGLNVALKPSSGAAVTYPGYYGNVGYYRNKLKNWKRLASGLFIPPQVSLA